MNRIDILNKRLGQLDQREENLDKRAEKDPKWASQQKQKIAQVKEEITKSRDGIKKNIDSLHKEWERRENSDIPRSKKTELTKKKNDSLLKDSFNSIEKSYSFKTQEGKDFWNQESDYDQQLINKNLPKTRAELHKFENLHKQLNTLREAMDQSLNGKGQFSQSVLQEEIKKTKLEIDSIFEKKTDKPQQSPIDKKTEKPISEAEAKQLTQKHESIWLDNLLNSITHKSQASTTETKNFWTKENDYNENLIGKGLPKTRTNIAKYDDLLKQLNQLRDQMDSSFKKQDKGSINKTEAEITKVKSQIDSLF